MGCPGQAQLQGTYLHRGGEAGVDVQVVDLVQAGPGKLEGQVPAARAAGDRWRSWRAPGDASSFACVPTRGNTQRSLGTPRAAARAAETMSTAEA